MYSYMTVKGQIVIPSKIRRKFGIKEGTRVWVEVNEQAHQIILTPATRDYIQSLRGKYKGKRLLTVVAAEKKCEREL
jgi:AbrB family looped-hinge helix DNA binding protein